MLNNVGDWLNDKKHGFGRLETRTYTYVGDFRHNRCHGNVINLFKYTLINIFDKNIFREQCRIKME